MNSKEENIVKINKYFKNHKVKNKFLEQLTLFYELNEKELEYEEYKLGQEVVLKKNNLMHGTRLKFDDLYKIKDNGLIAVEFYDKQYENQKKPYTCEFWKFNDDIKLKDYLYKYTGGTLIFKRKENNIEIIDCIDNLPKVIENMKEPYANWEIYQTKEARFLPTNPNVTCAFILNVESEKAKKMIANSVQSNLLEDNIKKKFLPKWFYNKNVKGGFHNYDVFETEREVAVIFGLPSSLIEGIVVNETIEKDDEKLMKIKELFSNSYICNIKGKIIK